MNTYWNTKTLQRFPASYSDEVKGKNLVRFVKGDGWLKVPLMDILGEVIPDLPREHTWDELADFARKWGQDCAVAEKARVGCGIIAHSNVAFALNPARPNDAFYRWFRETFQTPLHNYECHWSAAFGYFSFDIVRFDTFLHDRCDYTEEQHGSMEDFMTGKWGAEVVEKFRNQLLKTHGNSDNKKAA